MIPFGLETRTKKTLATVVALVLAVVAILAVISWKDARVDFSRNDAQETLATSSRPIFQPGQPLGESDPVRLRIPKISVDTDFVPLGLQDNGEVEVPEGYTEVGWYTYGPTPGELGPAVVLGHIDSYEGPGVFVFLGQLSEGDYVYVDRADGTTATFRVTTFERYNRDNFPTQTVYGDISFPGLRLITCSGTYDHQKQEYDKVLVVYATLVDTDDAK